MLGDTAVAVHPDPAAALEQAEADLRERLADAPAKEKPDLQAQIDEVQRRRREMLPQLERLRDMARRGVMLELPLTGRQIPLVADQWAKPELGSGCVKITPAHDQNDYDVWQRHLEIGAVNILNPDGTLNDNVPEKYRGQTVMDARKAVVADLEAAGLVVEIEDREVELAHSDRSKTPIEPYLTDQWFVKMDELAQSAMDAVSDGRVKIIPERYAKGYLDWLSEKRDWPIGRQLWWGHRIAVWSITVPNRHEEISRTQRDFLAAFDEFANAFDLTGDIAVRSAGTSDVNYYLCARTDTAVNEINNFFSRHYGRFRVTCVNDNEPQPFLGDPPFQSPRYYADIAFQEMIGFMSGQEQDVLDTWFSSALWPHSTLGWPEQTEELKYYYPTSVLITNRDILTLWVARMVLMGLHNVGEVPFHEVYIHPKILDGYGEGMSKSKGNGVDPIDVIEKFGADALRFGMAYLTTETQDVRVPVEFECPHCQKLIEQTRENRTRPTLKCKHCQKPFSTQWAEKPEDKALPRGAVVSERFELARNFCNKLWNASRFSLMNLDGFDPGRVADDELLVEDSWILSRLATVTQQVTDALAEYRYADAARVLYDFAWDEFCSFYVEMVKGRLQGEKGDSPHLCAAPSGPFGQMGTVPFFAPSRRAVAQRVLAHTLDTLLRLLHPMIPFLTEDVWQRLGEIAPERGIDEIGPAAESIMVAPWPECDPMRQDAEIEAQFARFQEVLRAVRDIRARQGVAPKVPLAFSVRCNAAVADLIRPMAPYFESMANARVVAFGPDVTAPALSANVTLSGMDVYVDLAELIDVPAEIARKKQEVEKLTGFIAAKEKKLTNKSFVDRAPPRWSKKSATASRTFKTNSPPREKCWLAWGKSRAGSRGFARLVFVGVLGGSGMRAGALALGLRGSLSGTGGRRLLGILFADLSLLGRPGLGPRAARPRKTHTEADQQRLLARPQAARLAKIADQNGNRQRNRVAVLFQRLGRVLAVNRKPLAQVIEHEERGLVQQVHVHLVAGPIGLRQDAIDQRRHHFQTELDQFRAVHVEAAGPAAPLPRLDGLLLRAGAAFGHQQSVGPAAVGAENERAQRRLPGGFDQRGRRAVAKDRPQRAVGRVDVLRIRLGGDQQHAPGSPGANQPVGQRQPIDEARTAEIKIQGANCGGQPQPILHQTGSRGQGVVGRLRTEQQEVDRGPVDVSFGKELFGRRHPQIGGTLPRPRDVPLANPRLGIDQVHVPFRELGREKLIVLDLLGQVDSHGADRTIHHRQQPPPANPPSTLLRPPTGRARFKSLPQRGPECQP